MYRNPLMYWPGLQNSLAIQKEPSKHTQLCTLPVHPDIPKTENEPFQIQRKRSPLHKFSMNKHTELINDHACVNAAITVGP